MTLKAIKYTNDILESVNSQIKFINFFATVACIQNAYYTKERGCFITDKSVMKLLFSYIKVDN